MRIIRAIIFEIRVAARKYYLWRKKREAMQLHALTGKRYHVIPVANDKLKVVDNQFINQYNRIIKNIGRKITIEDLLKMSYFSTPVEGITRIIKNLTK